jgi:hypothetical protein
MVHQAELVACVVDGVDDVIEAGEIELVDVAAGDQVVNGAALALRVDGEETLPQGIDLGAADGGIQGMDLAVGVADIDIIVVDQRDQPDAGARAGLGCPGTDAADADNAEMRARERWQCRFTEYPGDTGESISIGLG